MAYSESKKFVCKSTVMQGRSAFLHIMFAFLFESACKVICHCLKKLPRSESFISSHILHNSIRQSIYNRHKQKGRYFNTRA